MSALPFTCISCSDAFFYTQYYFSEKSFGPLSTCVLVCLFENPKVLPHIPQNIKRMPNTKIKGIVAYWINHPDFSSISFINEKTGIFMQHLCSAESPLCGQKTHSLKARNSIFSFPSFLQLLLPCIFKQTSGVFTIGLHIFFLWFISWKIQLVKQLQSL